MPEFQNDLERSCFSAAGQVVTAVVSGARIRLAWVGDDGGGIAVEQPEYTLRHLRRLSRILVGGAAAAALYRCPTTEDARACVAVAFPIVDPAVRRRKRFFHPLQGQYQRIVEGIHELVEPRARRSDRVYVDDVGSRQIYWSMMIVSRHWDAVQAIAEWFYSFPNVEMAHGDAERIFKKATKEKVQ
jgi:hypothetical protein